MGNINNVLYVPNLKKNLLSVGTCTERGLEVTFTNERINILLQQRVVASGIKQSNQIYIMLFKVVPVGLLEVQVYSATIETQLWHKRLGHVHISKIN